MSDGNIQYEGVSELFFVKNARSFLWKQSSGQTILVSGRDVKRTAKIEFNRHAAEAQDAFVHQIRIKSFPDCWRAMKTTSNEAFDRGRHWRLLDQRIAESLSWSSK
jgi:hypothetical protein